MATRVLQFNVADDRLTSEQAADVEAIGKAFCTAMADKYTRGQVEHGGNLWEKGEVFLLDAAIEEAIDQVTYLLTLKRLQRERMARELASPLNGSE